MPLSTPVVVGNLTSLSVTGIGSNAAMDGGGVSRILEASFSFSLASGGARVRLKKTVSRTASQLVVFWGGCSLESHNRVTCENGVPGVREPRFHTQEP